LKSHQYTVKDLKLSIKDLPDDTIVHIERIEDVYFEKHNWETETKDWIPEQPGLETTTYLAAFGVAKINSEKKLIIVAHC